MALLFVAGGGVDETSFCPRFSGTDRAITKAQQMIRIMNTAIIADARSLRGTPRFGPGSPIVRNGAFLLGSPIILTYCTVISCDGSFMDVLSVYGSPFASQRIMACLYLSQGICLTTGASG